MVGTGRDAQNPARLASWRQRFARVAVAHQCVLHSSKFTETSGFLLKKVRNSLQKLENLSYGPDSEQPRTSSSELVIAKHPLVTSPRARMRVSSW